MTGHYTLVREFNGPRPSIVTLCGSIRFGEAFRRAEIELTLTGHIVLLNVMRSGSFTVATIAAGLDALCQRKIDLSDWVLVLDVGGYVGESTRREITYAQSIGIPVRYLTDWAPTIAAEAPGAHVHRALTAAGLTRLGGAA